MSDYGKCFPECQCGGDGYVERGPSGATYSFPCYPQDCGVPNCRCKERLMVVAARTERNPQ